VDTEHIAPLCINSGEEEIERLRTRERRQEIRKIIEYLKLKIG